MNSGEETKPTMSTLEARTMSPGDWFILILQAFGMWELIITLNDVVYVFNVMAKFTRLERSTVESLIVHAFLSFFLSMWLLKFAPRTARFFYPNSRQSSERDLRLVNPPLNIRSKGIFKMAMRVIGVWELVRAFDYWIEAFDIYAGYFTPTTTTIGSCFTHVAVYLVLAVYLLLGAPHIVRSIYSESSNPGDNG
jgi:hypothetical protein